MGGGDLNMKKSWHPALLVNQDKVWQAEKKASEEKKALRQLQKERDEERQLAELQRMQEAQTGKKRVEKLDWMYAAPTGGDGAMGGRFNERELEDYLLGKKRVDEALRAGDKDVGNTSKDFIAVQNANSARDTAAKVREDPILAMKKAEQAQLAALMNRPDIRRQLKAKQREKEGGDSKEERRERRRAEKEERRRDRHERRQRHDDDYSDDDRRRRERDRDSERSGRRDRDYNRDRSERRRDDRELRDRKRERSISPRRDRDRDDRRRDSPRRRRDESPRRDRDAGASVKREPDHSPRRARDEVRSPTKRERDLSPKREPVSRSPYENGSSSHSNNSRDHARDFRNGDRNGDSRDGRHANGHDDRNARERSFSGDNRGNGRAFNGNGNGNFHERPPRRASPERKPAANQLDDMRAARLAAMSASADQMSAERSTKLAQRAQEEKRIFEAEERARSRYHKDEAAGMFMKHQEQLGGSVGLAESLQRRGGKGLLRDI